MRTLLKLLILVAFASSPSSAGAAVSVATEPMEAAACPPVTLEAHHSVRGGCRIHIVGEQETQIVVDTAGGPVVISSCEDEIEALVDSDGEGYAYNIDMTGHGGEVACTRTACDEAAPSHVPIPWPIHIRSGPAGAESLDMTICLRMATAEEGFAGATCQLSIPMTETSNPHRQSFNAEDGIRCSNLPPVEFVGHWHTETASAGHPEIEVTSTSPPDPPLTVTDEDSSDPCPDVTLVSNHAVAGGCRIHIVGEQETQWVAGTAGGPVVISTCEDDIEAAIDSSGEGYLYALNFTSHPGPACTRAACDEGAPNHATIPWRVHLRETAGGDVLSMSYCLRNSATSEGTPGSPCSMDIPMSQTSNPHRQSFNFEAGLGCANLPPGALTFFGHWHTQSDAAHPEVVINH
jgi:hypothetical protein